MIFVAAQVYDASTLEKTLRALEFNPEFATLWNFRREILLALMQPADAEARKAMLDKELAFLERALGKVHRWALERLKSPCTL